LPAERIGGLASLQPGLRPMSASGHQRKCSEDSNDFRSHAKRARLCKIGTSVQCHDPDICSASKIDCYSMSPSARASKTRSDRITDDCHDDRYCFRRAFEGRSCGCSARHDDIDISPYEFSRELCKRSILSSAHFHWIAIVLPSTKPRSRRPSSNALARTAACGTDKRIVGVAAAGKSAR
jgi:hypothetical protein